MPESLLTLLIESLPGVLASARDLFTQNHPGEPVPTDEEVMAAFEQAFQSSRDKDLLWLAAHPTE